MQAFVYKLPVPYACHVYECLGFGSVEHWPELKAFYVLCCTHHGGMPSSGPQPSLPALYVGTAHEVCIIFPWILTPHQATLT